MLGHCATQEKKWNFLLMIDATAKHDNSVVYPAELKFMSRKY